ncbi:GumC family protein [Tropicimonas marinistellae]|uniref:GumC family protein n=1 Tax=Tropicimonas marinistellae TaxID=1739787 RepID=UPI000830B3F5|nr:polysaccharide biosynthesis tyrosine autokinase [Tropicimonas marinistellae]
MIKNDAATSQQIQLVDLHSLWRTVWSGRRLIFLAIAGALLLAIVYLRLTPPVYTAETMLVVDPSRLGHADLRGALTAGDQSGDRPRMDESLNDELQIAMSRRVLEMTAEALALDENPLFNPASAGETAKSTGDFGAVIARLTGGRTETMTDPQQIEDATRRAVVEALRSTLDARQEASSRVVRLSATLPDPLLAADIANTIARSYISLDQQDNIEATRGAEEWLRSRISDLEMQVQRSEEALNAYRVQAGLIDEAAIQSLTEQLDRLRRTALDARAARIQLEAAVASGNVTGAAEQLDIAREREEVLAASIEDSGARLSALTEAQSRVVELERQAETDRIIYERFLEQMKQMNALATFTTPRAQIIDAAEPPMESSGPSKLMTLVAAVIAGAIIGVLAVLFRDSRRDVFVSRDELERETGVPVLANLPEVSDLRDPLELTAHLRTAPDSEFSEAVRGLRATVFLDRPDGGAKVIALTSSQPNEGKSTIAMALAYAGTAAGYRTLLVDADLRKAQLTKYLGIKGETDIEGVLMEGGEIREAIQKDPSFDLEIIPSQLTGKCDPNTVNDQDVRWLISELRDRYDLIIFDTPPITPVFDAGVISKHCDMTLMLVKYGATRRAALAESLRRLQGLNVDVSGFIFNQVDFRKEASFRGIAYEEYAEYWSNTPGPHAAS